MAAITFCKKHGWQKVFSATQLPQEYCDECPESYRKPIPYYFRLACRCVIKTNNYPELNTETGILKFKNMEQTFDSLPKAIREKMLEHQEKQTGKRDAGVFRRRIRANSNSGGFHWRDTPENEFFWDKVLIEGDIDHFYTKYPKQESTYEILPEKVMWVSDCKIDENGKSEGYVEQRVVFGKKKGRWLAWMNGKDIQEAKKELSVITWKYAREITPEPEPIELTIQEVAEKLGIDPKRLRIKK